MLHKKFRQNYVTLRQANPYNLIVLRREAHRMLLTFVIVNGIFSRWGKS